MSKFELFSHFIKINVEPISEISYVLGYIDHNCKILLNEFYVRRSFTFISYIFFSVYTMAVCFDFFYWEQNVASIIICKWHKVNRMVILNLKSFIYLIYLVYDQSQKFIFVTGV